MVHKHIVFLGTATPTNLTVSAPSSLSSNFNNDGLEFSHMDVLLNIKGISSITFSVQEQFSDVGYVETGNSGAISTVGKTILAADGQTGQTNESRITYGHAMMGKGGLKQVVCTGTSTGLNADIYLIFYR